jgi:hypothetical protein
MVTTISVASAMRAPDRCLSEADVCDRFHWTREELQAAMASREFPAATRARLHGVGLRTAFWEIHLIDAWAARERQRESAQARLRDVLPSLIAALERVAALNADVHAIDALLVMPPAALPVAAPVFARWLASMRTALDRVA